MSIHRLTHLGICVSDLDRSIAFYQNALGFEEVGRYAVGDEATDRILELEDVELELVYLERDGWRIELLYYTSPDCIVAEKPRVMNAVGYTHLSFAVADIDAAVEAVEAAGGRVLKESFARFKSGNRGLFVVDPDGTRIEFIERLGKPNAIPGSDS